MRTLAALILCILAVSCNPDRQNFINSEDAAYVPQYQSLAEVEQISVQAVRTTRQAGKIYAFGNYLFQSDVQEGIHIINNTDPRHPVKLAFLKVPFSTEIAIKGNFLYTNNLNDLVVFDISTIEAPRLVKRIEKVFPVIEQKYPPFNNVRFECPDPAKGVVVKWELKNSKTALCRR